VPFEHRVARPSAEREASKAEMLDRYMAPELDDLRRRADETYARFVEGV